MKHCCYPSNQLLIILLITFLNAVPLSATIQEQDVLIFNGIRSHIDELPLSSLAKNEYTLPEPEIVTSGCWRGYVATWCIEENELRLCNFKDAGHKKLSIETVFNKSKPLKATWYSGLLTFRSNNNLFHALIRNGDLLSLSYFPPDKSAQAGIPVVIYKVDMQVIHEKLNSSSWIDGRFLLTPFTDELKKSGKKFSFRGYFGAFSSISLPSNDKTPEKPKKLHRIFMRPFCDEWCKVKFLAKPPEPGSSSIYDAFEFKGRYVKVDGHFLLHIESYKKVVGEAMLDTKFPF